MIVWNSPSGVTVTLGDHVKDWSYDELKSTFEGKLDYVSLAKFLGIKKTKAAPVDEPVKKAKKGKGSDKRSGE